jgi:transposase, IS5 family
VGKLALIKQQRYAHAKQFKRANKRLRTLKTYLRRVIRDIQRKVAGDEALKAVFAHALYRSKDELTQGDSHQRPRVIHRMPADD